MQDTHVANHNVLVNMLTQLLTKHSICVVFLKTTAYFCTRCQANKYVQLRAKDPVTGWCQANNYVQLRAKDPGDWVVSGQ